MKPLLPIISIFLIISCTQLSQEEQDIKENLNKAVKLDMFDIIRQGDTTLPYSEWREQYNYISLVYLEVACSPCYDTFIEWQTAMDTISPGNDYTVLFIIQGESYEKFMENVFQIDPPTLKG